jgi:hypothetical protein
VNERSTDTLIRSRVREKESGLDESPVQSRRRRPELLLGIALVVLGALGGVILQQRGDDSVLVVALARDVRSGDNITAADLRAMRVERSAAGSFVAVSDAQGLVGQVARIDAPAGTPIVAAMFGTDAPLQPGEAIVPLALDSGAYPPDLRVGDVVRVITSTPPGLGELRTPEVVEPAVVVHDVRSPEQFSDRAVIALRGPLLMARAVSGTVDVRLVRVGDDPSFVVAPDGTGTPTGDDADGTEGP